MTDWLEELDNAEKAFRRVPDGRKRETRTIMSAEEAALMDALRNHARELIDAAMTQRLHPADHHVIENGVSYGSNAVFYLRRDRDNLRALLRRVGMGFYCVNMCPHDGPHDDVCREITQALGDGGAA